MANTAQSTNSSRHTQYRSRAMSQGERKQWLHNGASMISVQKLNLFTLVSIGGLAVLGSYAWGLLNFPELRSALWGGVPEAAIPLYSSNMFFAASGFLLALAMLLRHGSPALISQLKLPYALILIPSALWLPLTIAVLQQPSAWLWYLTRLDLALVAIGSLMLYKPIAQACANNLLQRRFTLGLYSFFVLQVLILDALIWPAYFPVLW